MTLLAIQYWRVRAEQYRTTGEGIVTPSARNTYLTLARQCDQIADNLGRPPRMGKLRLG